MQRSSAESSMSTNTTAAAIEEAFRAFDTTFSGSISVDDVLTLFLGMGYQPETMTVEELRSRSGDKDSLKLREIQSLLRQYPRFRPGADRNAHLRSLFHAILPEGAKTTLGRDELLAIFKDEGGIDLTDDKADAILQCIRSDENDENSSEPTSVQVSEDDFVRFLSPSPPSS